MTGQEKKELREDIKGEVKDIVYENTSFEVAVNKALDFCIEHVSANYINKNDLPSEKEIYDELMDTFINSNIDDVPDGLLEKTATAIHDRIMGGKK